MHENGWFGMIFFINPKVISIFMATGDQFFNFLLTYTFTHNFFLF